MGPEFRVSCVAEAKKANNSSRTLGRKNTCIHALTTAEPMTIQTFSNREKWLNGTGKQGRGRVTGGAATSPQSPSKRV